VIAASGGTANSVRQALSGLGMHTPGALRVLCCCAAVLLCCCATVLLCCSATMQLCCCLVPGLLLKRVFTLVALYESTDHCLSGTLGCCHAVLFDIGRVTVHSVGPPQGLVGWATAVSSLSCSPEFDRISSGHAVTAALGH
jgi:hypothetical protein